MQSKELGNDCNLEDAWGVDALRSPPIGDMEITYFPDAREVALQPLGMLCYCPTTKKKKKKKSICTTRSTSAVLLLLIHTLSIRGSLRAAPCTDLSTRAALLLSPSPLKQNKTHAR